MTKEKITKMKESAQELNIRGSAFRFVLVESLILLYRKQTKMYGGPVRARREK